jgi:hypothetical protein
MMKGLLANIGLGAKQPAKDAYETMIRSAAFAPSAIRSWSSSSLSSMGESTNETTAEGSNLPSDPNVSSNPPFSIMEYDVIILPGGHDKGVKQIIESESLRVHLNQFFPHTKGDVDAGERKKVCAAIW